MHKMNVTHEVNEKYKGERSVVLSNPFSSNNVFLIPQEKKMESFRWFLSSLWSFITTKTLVV